ncbi:MAG: sugar transferase [Elusimicrobiota bacterium]|jgi:exopolysaccharide biosynthesis polyprenyl glycosylphosphotransferase
MTMHRHYLRIFFIASLLLLDISGLIAAFQGAYWTRFSWPVFTALFPPLKGIPDIHFYQQALWALLPICLLVFGYMGFYRDTLQSAYDELILVSRGILICSLLTTAVTFAYRGVEYSRLVLGLWAVYSVSLLYILRECDKLLFRWLTERVVGPRHVLVVGKGKTANIIHEMAGHQPFVKATFMETVPDAADLMKRILSHHISEVLLIQGLVSSSAILEASRACESLDLECKIVPDLLEMRRGEIIFDRFCGLPTFRIKPLSLHGANFYMKRIFDIVVSLAILSVCVIPLILIAALIRLDTPGPILFSQKRVGFRGREFKLFKFRTMVANADDYIEELKHLSDREGPVFKMKNDPRITWAGSWLRALSLDELPQIINVLKGDMSLVGPRPQVLWEAAHYDENAKKRLRVLPGITGLWQVSGRASLSYEEMINLDIFYLENWSLGLDLKILIRTLPAIFAREGAY